MNKLYGTSGEIGIPKESHGFNRCWGVLVTFSCSPVKETNKNPIKFFFVGRRLRW